MVAAAPVALVTGGANGIGWAICQRLAADGYRVALADLDSAAAANRIATLGAAHRALPVDLTDRQAAANLPGQVVSEMGGLDVVINNAGMTVTDGQPLTTLPEADFDRLVALNLTAVEAICATASGLLPLGGRIVNLASGASWRPLALRGPYSATKAGIMAYTKALAADLAPRGITVTAVAPGYTRTPLVEALEAAGRVDLARVAAGIPMQRIAEPEDIAATVAFLAGPDSAAFAGGTLLVDGGGSIGPAPQAEAPRSGTAAQGEIAILGALPDATEQADERAIDRAALTGFGPMSALIDAEGLAGLGPADSLARARQTALACAGHSDRTAGFALLFVSAAGTGPAASAAEAARAMLARTLALEWAPAGMRVNALTWHGHTTDGLAAACRFLTGPDAGFITGQALHAGEVGSP
jgi:NAD(P)-dependent dehydrogenase (short-subunit alcohol dehydrogenase family)